MQTNKNQRIKKSKLVFGVVNQSSIIPSNIIDDKQIKISQMTFRSIRHSHLTYKTVNYKNYDTERKNLYEKRKHHQKPLSLYLDGANPSNLNNQSEKIKQLPAKSNITNFQDQPLSIGLINQPKDQKEKRLFASKKSLKAIILKQIQLKNKRKISQNKKIKIDFPQFSDVQQLFTLKKIQKSKNSFQNKIKLRISNKKLTVCDNSLIFHKQQGDMNTSQKFSVFSERSVVQKKNKKILKNPQNLSQVILPSVERNKCRPLITLDFNESKKIESQSFIVFKYPQKQIVSGKAYKKNGQIASLTKIMTFYTILHICQEYNINYAQRIIQIIQKAQDISGTSAYIFSGEKYSLQQLFYAMMLPSGNDAAMAIACQGGLILKEKLCKIINLEQDNFKCFIKYMNFLAKNIGMLTSAFTNPHGLSDPNNHSNPYQMSLLISESLKFDEFLKVVGTKSYSCWIEGISEKREVIWQNTHKLLRRQGFIGGKTGVTVTAGPCLATIYKSSSQQTFITVVLRAPKLSRRFKQTRWILGYSLKQYKTKYDKDVKLILKQNAQLDSDNSEDEQKFDFNKNDSVELRKRNKILVYEL